MKTETYKTKSGKTQFRPVFDEEFETLLTEDGNVGFCLACGSEDYGVEPDARAYSCVECNAPKVYGLEELLLMGLVSTRGVSA